MNIISNKDKWNFLRNVNENQQDEGKKGGFWFVLHPLPIYILVKDLSGLSVFHMLLIINLAASFLFYEQQKPTANKLLGIFINVGCILRLSS